MWGQTKPADFWPFHYGHAVVEPWHITANIIGWFEGGGGGWGLVGWAWHMLE